MNVKQMRARVRRQLGDAGKDIPKDEILELLKEAERLMLTETSCKRIEQRYPYDYDAEDAYKLPIDPNTANVVMVMFDGYYLPEVDPYDFRQVAGLDFDSLGEGFPEVYMIWNNQIHLLPHPNSGQDGKWVKFWAVQTHSALQDDDDEPFVPAAYCAALVHYVVANLTSDAGVMQRHMGAFGNYMAALKGHVNRTLPPVYKTEIG